MAWTISGTCCNLRSDLSTRSNHEQDTRHMFDEMSTQEWRSLTRVLDITVHHACYPITEKLLHQVFSPFGAVEHVRVSRESVPVLAQVVFKLRNDAAEAFGELHGRNIYDGCCQMEIEWGVSQELDVPMVSKCSSKRGISTAIATSNGDATTSSSMAQLPSATDAISTINNLSSEQALVAASRSHINVAAAAAVCINIDEVAQPVAVLNVMDHTVVDELLMPTLPTFAMDVVPFFNLAITPSATSDDRCKDIDPDAHQALDDMMLESINFHTNSASLELPIDDFPYQQKFMCGPIVIDDFLEYLARELISFTCLLEYMLVLSMRHIELTPWPPPAGFAPTSGGAELCVIPWPSLIGQVSFKLWHVTSIQDTVTSYSAGQSHCHVFSTEHHTICLLPVNQLKAWCISEALLLFGKVSIINYGFPSRDDKITKGEISRPWDPGNSCCRGCIRIGQSMIHRMTIQRKLGASQ